MPSVVTTNAVRNTAAVPSASHRRPRRHSQPATTNAARQANWPTVVSACNWFDDGKAGHWTRPIALSETIETTAASTVASTIRPPTRPARTSAVVISDGQLAEDRPRDVPHDGHQVAHRVGRPDQLLALARRDDRHLGEVFLVHRERCFLGAGGLPVLQRGGGAHLAGTDDQNPNSELAQRFSQSQVEAVE